MTTSPDILAAQAAYRARPFAAAVSWSHGSIVNRFHTEAEAIDYLFHQYARVQRIIRSGEFGSSWVGFDTRNSWLEGPRHGKVPARLVLMASDLCSSWFRRTGNVEVGQ